MLTKVVEELNAAKAAFKAEIERIEGKYFSAPGGIEVLGEDTDRTLLTSINVDNLLPARADRIAS